MKKYFNSWYLRMNTTKSVSTVFHLNNREAHRRLKINIDGTALPTEENPKYLGVTLDRQLTYKRHLEGVSRKIGKRNCILRKLAGTTWGASQTLLRTSSLALCYSVAEYCAPVWTRSAHTSLVDVKLRDSMRIVTGCLKPTPVQWLTVMSAIAPPHLRREEMNRKWIERAQAEEITPLQKNFQTGPINLKAKIKITILFVQKIKLQYPRKV